MQKAKIAGQCLCGAVRFELSPPIRDVIVCHCRQCAQWTGYAVAAAAVPPERFALLAGSGDLKWYASSPHAERGFCGLCGSSLFWKPADRSRISVLAGSLEPPTGLTVSAHIFVADKSDYYDIEGTTPQFAQGAGDFGRPPRDIS